MWKRFKCWIGAHDWTYFPSAAKHRWIPGERSCRRCGLHERQVESYAEIAESYYTWAPIDRRHHNRKPK